MSLSPVLITFYVLMKRAQTIDVLLMKLRGTIVCNVQVFSLLKIFKAIGFRWEKFESTRELLLKKQNVGSVRREDYMTPTSKVKRLITVTARNRKKIHSFHTADF